ncbi:putative periplasmic protein [Variovorax sp. PBL-E5]|nr:putative periplasmic protein [Variovorax sp. PBL-E5]
MHLRYPLAPIAMSALFASPAFAAGLGASIEIPRLNVAEYHRPYVAAWIERADNSMAGTLAVWYDVRTRTNNPEGEGTKWLKDLRQWWRRGGRELSMPVDGVTGATKPAGKQQLNFTEGMGAMPQLAPGAYKFVVEAAREVGGREVVSIPFQWPPTTASQSSASGKEELGEIKLELKP